MDIRRVSTSLSLLVVATACSARYAMTERAVADSERVDLLLTNARVITGTGRVLGRASIVIGNGIILDVQNGEATRRAARTIDLAGRTVLPGLIDTHVHLLVGDGNSTGARMPLSTPALAAYLENALPALLRSYLSRGVTTVLSTGDYFPAILEVRERTLRESQHGPRVLVTGPVICARDGHPVRTICGRNEWCAEHLARQVTTLTDVEAAVRELAAAKVDMVKLVHDAGMRSPLERELLEGAIRVAHAHKLRAVVHAGSIEEASEAVAAGADRLVHPPWVDVVPSAGFGRTLKRRGVSVASTLSISAISDEWEASHGRPARYLPNVMANVRLLRRAGVTLAFGTDVPMRSVEDGLDLEMRLLQEVGLSRSEIIQSATRDSAAFLGILDQVGTLEPGKRADLMIVRGDPLETFTALRNVELVLRDGRVVFEADQSRYPQ